MKVTAGNGACVGGGVLGVEMIVVEFIVVVSRSISAVNSVEVHSRAMIGTEKTRMVSQERFSTSIAIVKITSIGSKLQGA